MDIKTIEKNISKIKSMGVEMDDLIHVTAVGLIKYVNKGRGESVATELVKAMPKSGRKQALILWIEDHTKLEWYKKDKEFKRNKDKTIKENDPNATPFWDYSKEAKPFVWDSSLENFVKKMEREASKEGADMPVALMDKIRELREFIPTKKES